MAVKELLLVLIAIGSGMVVIQVIDPLSKEQHDSAFPVQAEAMFRRELRMGGEFVCLVALDKFARPDSSVRPYYVSHVRFARRSPRPFVVFLLDITADDRPSWRRNATCRAWTLMTPDAALDHLHELGRLARAPSQLTPQERTLALCDHLWWDVREVASLEEPLSRCVPAHFQETGVVAVTKSAGLSHIHEFQDFSLSGLAAAIRAAARDDRWTTGDPAALLPPNNAGSPELSDDEEQAIARALVYRLLEYLPQ